MVVVVVSIQKIDQIWVDNVSHDKDLIEDHLSFRLFTQIDVFYGHALSRHQIHRYVHYPGSPGHNRNINNQLNYRLNKVLPSSDFFYAIVA